MSPALNSSFATSLTTADTGAAGQPTNTGTPTISLDQLIQCIGTEVEAQLQTQQLTQLPLRAQPSIAQLQYTRKKVVQNLSKSRDGQE